MIDQAFDALMRIAVFKIRQSKSLENLAENLNEAVFLIGDNDRKNRNIGNFVDVDRLPTFGGTDSNSYFSARSTGVYSHDRQNVLTRDENDRFSIVPREKFFPHDFYGMGVEAAKDGFFMPCPESNANEPSFDDYMNLVADIGFKPSVEGWNEYRNAFIQARIDMKDSAKVENR